MKTRARSHLVLFVLSVVLAENARSKESNVRFLYNNGKRCLLR